jgi:hypothetical protein
MVVMVCLLKKPEQSGTIFYGLQKIKLSAMKTITGNKYNTNVYLFIAFTYGQQTPRYQNRW